MPLYERLLGDDKQLFNREKRIYDVKKKVNFHATTGIPNSSSYCCSSHSGWIFLKQSKQLSKWMVISEIAQASHSGIYF